MSDTARRIVAVGEAVGVGETVGVGEALTHIPAVNGVVASSLRQRHALHAVAVAPVSRTDIAAHAPAAEQQQPPAHTFVVQSKAVVQAWPGDKTLQPPKNGVHAEQPRRAASEEQQ